MSTPRTWFHEGRYLTAAQIAKLNPRLKASTIKSRLAKGATVAEALAPPMSASEAGRKGKEAGTRIGFGRVAG